MSKRIVSFLVLTVVFVLTVVVAPHALAAAPSPSDSFTSQGNFGFQNASLKSLPKFIFNSLFLIAGLLAAGYLMFGGIKYITSRGDRVAVEGARKHIMAAIIGLVIVIGSFFILNTVFQLTGANNPLNGNCVPTVNDPDCSGAASPNP